MKDNHCNYSDEWQPYIGDYDKFEYDIRLKDGTVVENCYPNADKFNSISDEHNSQSFPAELVADIRFSENPRFGINGSVSEREQYKWLAKGVYSSAAQDAVIILERMKLTSELMSLPRAKKGRGKVVPVRTEPKIGRNDICPKCDSGKKYKHCCI